MKRLSGLVLFVLLLAGCQANRLVRVPLGGAPDGPPVIDGLIDLGGVLLSKDNGLDRAESDKSFIAGEWVAIIGKGLNANGSRLFLDNAEFPIQGGLTNGLLFRMPRDVRFRHTYSVRVQTPSGSAEASLPVTNLLVMADARADQVLVWRTSADQKQVFDDQSVAVPCKGAGAFAFAPAGGLLYVVASEGKAKGEGLTRFELKTFDLAAKAGPKEISSLVFEARYQPISLVVSPTNAHGFLLTAGELVLFDLADPEHPKLAIRQDLPSRDNNPGYGDMVLLAGGSRGAIVDEAGKQVLLMDFSKPSAPLLLGSFKVNRTSETDFRPIGLTADRGDPNMLWVLAGLNAHQVRLNLSALWSGKKSDQPQTTRAALIRLELKDDSLAPQEPRMLPEGVLPFGLLAEKNGDILTSAVAYEKELFSQVDLSLKGASNLVKGVWNSIFAGRIYRMKPDGTISMEAQSMNLPLSLARIEDSPLVYSAYRLSITYVFPSATVLLAADVLDKQSLEVREMDWKTILPPYQFFPQITVL